MKTPSALQLASNFSQVATQKFLFEVSQLTFSECNINKHKEDSQFQGNPKSPQSWIN